ncbi:Helix-turn-helix domain-containing protein [Lentzea fradiae]|uniref:Helix-turn-helix domain-containing protein n=1 Tax=Lentzea fradiae TaxID=200378 RepID=A0A1G7RHZ7_9PSEU|nr:helix-turn-helix domain-containing protein [Lentzea fradiae]SDG09660.1 Helix-turn-helix domain-containing protein [Lentzea fradiae]
MRDFGELLRTHRIRAGLTQQQLADFAMVSVRAIRDLECGRTRTPRAETVRLLAEGLRLDETSRADLAKAGGRTAARAGAAPPAPAGAIVGREVETAALVALLSGCAAGGQRRLVTITGLSGVGKTRLALEAAGELHFRHGWSVLWHPASPPSADDDQDTVLVTDRCPEPRLLAEHPRLRVLVTALAPTGLPGEHVFPLSPLSDEAAVRLLLTHVHRVRPGFRAEPANQAALTGLVKELDGLPSALEFAAGWFMVYSPQHLLERLRANPVDPTSAHLRDALRRSLSTLDEDGRRRLVDVIENRAHGDLRDLVVRGLVRRAGMRYEALNLVRAAVLEPQPDRDFTGGVALSWPC